MLHCTKYRIDNARLLSPRSYARASHALGQGQGQGQVLGQGLEFGGEVFFTNSLMPQALTSLHTALRDRDRHRDRNRDRTGGGGGDRRVTSERGPGTAVECTSRKNSYVLHDNMNMGV